MQKTTFPLRCDWCTDDPDYQAYHDLKWGVPLYDSTQLFSLLILEGQQAGLSWITILKKEPAYRGIFLNLDPYALARIQGQERADFIQKALGNKAIIRNRLKIEAIFKNADAYLRIEAKQAFRDYLWQFVEHRPKQNSYASQEQVPTQDAVSQAMAKQLKKDGFSFVGPTIMYAFMEASGMVNDHLTSCFRHAEIKRSAQQVFDAQK